MFLIIYSSIIQYVYLGVYEGHQVFDHNKVVPPYGTSIGGGSPNRKPLGDIYTSNNNLSGNNSRYSENIQRNTARDRYEEYLRSMDLKTSSQPASRSVIGYDDTRAPSLTYEPPSHYGNSLDDDKYYRSDFKHPTESHSHSTYKAPHSVDGTIMILSSSPWLCVFNISC